MISLRKVIYKVQMQSGKLTKDLWVYNEVKAGDLVRDETGEVFRIISVTKTESSAIQGSKLEVIKRCTT